MREEHDVMNWKKRNWYKIGLILCLMLALVVVPVLAYDYSEDFIHQDAVTQDQWTVTFDGTGAEAGLIKSFRIVSIDNYQSVTAIISTQGSTSYTWDYSVQSYSVTVEAYAGSLKIGEGVLGFNNNTATHNLVTFFYPTYWNTQGLTGYQWINFTDPADPVNFAAHGLKDLTHTGQHCSVFTGGYGGWASPTSPEAFIGIYTINNQFYFRNTAYLTQEGNSIHATVYKTLLGVPYKSRVFLYKNDSETGIITSDLALTTTNFDQYITLQPVKIVVWDRLGNHFNSSYYYSSYIGGYSISINPTTATPIQNITGTLSSSIDFNLDSVTQIAWEYQDTDGVHNLYENGNESRPMFYTKIGTNWYGYDVAAFDFLNDKGTAIPNPVQFKVPTSGAKTILCTVIDATGNAYYLSTPATISSGYITTRARAIDWQTGYAIYGAQIAFRDVTNATWTNTTTTSANFGDASVTTPPGHYFNIYANATGYTNAQLLGVPAQDTSVYSLFMYPSGNVTAALGNTTLYVTVTDESMLNGIAGATVRVSSVVNQSYNQLSYTANSGIATFIVANQSQYYVSAQAFGYQGAAGTVTIVAEPMYSYSLALRKAVATVTPTTVLPTLVGQPGVVHYTRESAIAESWDVIIQGLVMFVNMGWIALWFTMFWLMANAIVGNLPGLGMFGFNRRKK